jgi:hypothetical protein
MPEAAMRAVERLLLYFEEAKDITFPTGRVSIFSNFLFTSQFATIRVLLEL